MDYGEPKEEHLRLTDEEIEELSKYDHALDYVFSEEDKVWPFLNHLLIPRNFLKITAIW